MTEKFKVRWWDGKDGNKFVVLGEYDTRSEAVEVAQIIESLITIGEVHSVCNDTNNKESK